MFNVKLFICALCIMIGSQNIVADMIYDPVRNLVYSNSKESNINQDEYRYLLGLCLQLEQRLLHHVPSKQNFKQVLAMLEQVQTPTARQLIKDLKKKKIFFPDGSVYKKLVI